MIINCKEIADNIKYGLPKGNGKYLKLWVKTGNLTTDGEMYLKGIKKDAEEYGIELFIGKDEPYNWSRVLNKVIDLTGNMHNRYLGNIENPIPCVVEAVFKVLGTLDIYGNGKIVLVIGRSENIGEVLAKQFLHRNATVIQAHSKTTQKQLEILMACADIVISCAGVPNLIKGHIVKPSHVIIDVGNDVDFDNVADKVAYITPQKQGIGLVTRACLLRRLVKC